jgi:hypothetical protein
LGHLAPVLLIGSVPLNSATDVFSVLAERLGGLASRYPDGETGERINWVRWQRHVFDENPNLELVVAKRLPGFNDTIDRPFYALRADADLKRFAFKPLGYSSKAIESYAEFRRLKQQGLIPETVKFQVCMPTAVSLLSVFVNREHRASIEPALERALEAEVIQLAAKVPHGELAIQWDVCHEVVGHDGGIDLHFGNILSEASERCARLVNFVPPDIEVGLHLCYGDPGHKHVIEPVDTGTCVAFCNRIASLAKRTIDYVHIPIPRGFKSAEQYRPLSQLTTPAATGIYLGLVHYTDGLAGTQERISIAKKYCNHHFGIATECGFGRRNPQTLYPLLDLHRQAVTALD